MLTKFNSASDIDFGQAAFQQEGSELGECIDVITTPDVPAAEFNAVMNIRILLTVNQGSHGLGSPILDLHFNRDHGSCCSDEKILFKSRIIPFMALLFDGKIRLHHKK